ncbi:MAG: aminotransferase class I/II-fold pyridoxal phosphate-dependent enzyme [Clostridium sartagoforme]|nr:aminotransferase class I/II-fold pyridoxal phosphate-dependent enzyme [Clostridium sartagoforme]
MNSNLDDIEMSGIRRFFNKVKDVDGAISLTLGQPDFKTPMEIKYGMIKAIEEDKTIYTDNFGLLELRKEISRYLKSKKINFEYDEICITVGASEALFSSIVAVVNKGDKVLVPTPAYPAYENIVKIIGGKVVNYNLNDDFSLNIDKLERVIKEDKIKYMILSYPSNPTGAVLNKDEYVKLVEIIRENNINIISDEIYEAFCYDKYYSVAMSEDIKDNVIYIGGFSKMFSITGIRIGFIAAKKAIINEIGKVHQYNVSCSNSIGQYGVLEGLKYGLYNINNMKEEFIKRKAYVEERLRNMNIDFVSPKGAFYIFPSIKKFNMNSELLCEKLLYEEKVACVPGNAFGVSGEGYIRISYCYSIDELSEGLNRIENFTRKYSE